MIPDSRLLFAFLRVLNARLGIQLIQLRILRMPMLRGKRSAIRQFLDTLHRYRASEFGIDIQWLRHQVSPRTELRNDFIAAV